MMPHRISLLLFNAVLCLGWGMAAGPVQAQTFAGAAQRSSTPARTIEPRGSTISHFVVVGAVQRPGVFSSPSPALPLNRLIEIAGGMREDALPTIRVLHNGRSRLQILFDPQQSRPDDLIYGGDLIVVASRPAPVNGSPPAESHPVACLGLLDRPIVLPLDPAIATIDDLIPRLPQSERLAEHVRVIDPFGRETRKLIPGTVLLFESGFVNRSTLALNTFPPVIDADAAMPVIPAPLPMEPASSLDLPLPPLPFSRHQPEPVPDLQLPEPTPPAPEYASATVVTAAAELESPPLATPAFPMSAPIPALPPDDFAPAPYEPAATLPVRTAMIDPAALILEPAAAQPAAALTIAPPAAASTEIAESLFAEPAPTPWPRKVAAISPAQLETSIQELAGDLNPATPGNTPARPGSRLLPIAGGMLALFICLGLSFFAIGGIRKIATPATEMITAPSQIEPIPERAANPEIATDPMSGLLGRSLPLVEEPAALPSQLKLHGAATGHRRLILHHAHESVQRPHFAAPHVPRERQVAARSRVDERELRKSLREACRSSEEAAADIIGQSPPLAGKPIGEPKESPVTAQPAAATAPVNSLEIEETTITFDVVQPEIHKPLGERRGTLDRALRTLASEKLG